jgi:hypothetical protein
VLPAASNIKDSKGHLLVTAYSVLRPDGQGDSNHYFSGNVDQISFGADNYSWHADGQDETADPDGPAATSIQNGGKGAEYTLPTASVTVLRGTVQ